PDEPISLWKTPKTVLKLPNTPAAVAALAHELHDRLENVTCERDALVSLLSNKPIVQDVVSEQPKKLERAEAAAMRAEAAYQIEAARSRQFEQELAHLQQVRDELNERLAREDAQRAESKTRSEELERRLSESSGEIERL